MRAISTMTMSGSVFIVMLIFTIYIFFKINITENLIYMLILFLPFPIINFIFYRMLYAKGKYKEIIEKNLNFAITLKSINGSLGDISGESPFWEFCLHPPGIPWKN